MRSFASDNLWRERSVSSNGHTAIGIWHTNTNNSSSGGVYSKIRIVLSAFFSNFAAQGKSVDELAEEVRSVIQDGLTDAAVKKAQ